MDAGYFLPDNSFMTLFIVFLILLALALAGPLFGADTRVTGGWRTSEPDRPLWTGAGRRSY